MPDAAALEMPSRQGPAISATAGSDAPQGPRPAPAISATARKGSNPDVAFLQQRGKPAGENGGEGAQSDPKPKDKSDDADEGDEAKPSKAKPEAADGDETEGETAEAKAARIKSEKAEAGRIGEITKERNRRRAAEDEAREAKAQLAQALKALEAVNPKKADAVSTNHDNDPKPKREQFQNPDEYDAALIAHTARVTARTVKAEADADRVKADQEARNKAAKELEDKQGAEFQKQFQKKYDAGKAKYQDFEEKVNSEDVPVSIHTAHAIIESDNAAELMYHLATHVEEAKAIFEMTPGRQVIAIGRLSERIENPKVEISKAPGPYRPVGNRASSATRKDPNEETMEEYAARRNAERRVPASGGNAKPS